MFWRIEKSYSMFFLFKEFHAAVKAFQYPVFFLFAKILHSNAFVFGNQAHQAFGFMRIELVGNKYPSCLGIGVNCFLYMFCKIKLATGFADKIFADTSRGDIKTRNQAKCTVPFIFSFAFFGLPGKAPLSGAILSKA